MKLNLSWILFPFMLISAAVFRAYQLFVAIDIQTGFYRDGNVSEYLLVGSLLVFAGIIWLVNRKTNTPRPEFVLKRSFGMAFVCLLLIASEVYYSVLLWKGFWEPKANFTSAIDFLKSTEVEYTVFLMLAITVLSIVTWILFMLSYVMGKNLLNKVKGFVLLIPIWVIVRIVVSFMRYTAVADISSNLFDVVTMCVTLYLLYHLARVWSGVEVVRAKKALFFFALVSAALVLICCITVVAAYVHIDDQGQLYGRVNFPAYDFTITDILISLFCLGFAAMISSSAEQNAKESDVGDQVSDTESDSLEVQEKFEPISLPDAFFAPDVPEQPGIPYRPYEPVSELEDTFELPKFDFDNKGDAE